jgi:hypothetical protein
MRIIKSIPDFLHLSRRRRRKRRSLGSEKCIKTAIMSDDKNAAEEFEVVWDINFRVMKIESMMKLRWLDNDDEKLLECIPISINFYDQKVIQFPPGDSQNAIIKQKSPPRRLVDRTR